MTSQTCFALFWGWLTVIVTAMFFIRPKALHDVKQLIVENRAFGLTYGYFSLFLDLASVLLHKSTRIALVVVGAVAIWMLGATYA